MLFTTPKARYLIVGPERKGKRKLTVAQRILTPPQTCSTTIKSAANKLAGLDAALEKTSLYPALDTSKNVTCLAPITSAFDAAGNPEEALDNDNLTQALLFHTLAEVTYSNFLTDGQRVKTLKEGSFVTVRIKENGDIFFNNAKVVAPNVLTNNGLIHM